FSLSVLLCASIPFFSRYVFFFFFFQAEDGIRDFHVTGVQTCALPIFALVIAVAIIWLFFSWQTDGGFLTPRNLSNLLRQMSITGILACGMVLVIISGEIDLSVGSIDRKSTRLNSSHVKSSYAVFCLKKKQQAYDRRM